MRRGGSSRLRGQADPPGEGASKDAPLRISSSYRRASTSGPALVFLGLNELGSRILNWLVDQGERVECVLTRREQLPLLRRLKPDLVVACGFRYLVPSRFLDIPPLGCINVHTSYLPFNRGTYTNAWSILESTPAGVSIHKMAPRVDSGPVLARRRVDVAFSDTGKTLFEKLQVAGFELFVEQWPSIRSGEWRPRPQETEHETYHSDRQFWDLMRIDLDQMVRGGDLINRLRALTFPPYDNAFVEVDGRRYYLRLDIREAAGNGVGSERSESLPTENAGPVGRHSHVSAESAPIADPPPPVPIGSPS